ncbi:MAG: exodeoxyribonuclease VII small subunit [Gammaproteobacteria bacterium]|nr:exodeoxyribonuclease VII small subunit [Gammaproteobacteria bacterium]
MAKKTAARNFEQGLQELEQLVERLEQGDLSLDDSMGEFERGIQLARQCQTQLSQSEQKVAILLEKDAQADLHPFTGDD